MPQTRSRISGRLRRWVFRDQSSSNSRLTAGAFGFLSFTVENAGTRPQAGQGLDNERKAIGQVIAGAAVEPHPLALLPGDNPEAIVLDLDQPFRP
jgi:hypothetical protein